MGARVEPMARSQSGENNGYPTARCHDEGHGRWVETKCARTRTPLSTFVSQHTRFGRLPCNRISDILQRAPVASNLRGCAILSSTRALLKQARCLRVRGAEGMCSARESRVDITYVTALGAVVGRDDVADGMPTHDSGDGLHVTLVTTDIACGGAIGRPPRGGKWRVASLCHAFGPSYVGRVQNALLNAHATRSVDHWLFANVEPSPQNTSK